MRRSNRVRPEYSPAASPFFPTYHPRASGFPPLVSPRGLQTARVRTPPAHHPRIVGASLLEAVECIRREAADSGKEVREASVQTLLVASGIVSTVVAVLIVAAVPFSDG